MIVDGNDSVVGSSRGMFTSLPSVEDKDPLYEQQLVNARANQQNISATSIEPRLLAVNNGSPVKVLVGNSYSHLLTSDELGSTNTTFVFTHSLGYTPTVQGSVAFVPFTATTDAHPLPYISYGASGSYFNKPPSYAVTVDTVGSTTITIRVVIEDIFGATFLEFNSNLYFRLYCFNYSG